jgi:hypothetical protein
MKYTTTTNSSTKLDLLDLVIQDVRELSEQSSSMAQSVNVPLNLDGPLSVSIETLISNYINVVNTLTGDESDYLGWYIWENNFGEKKLEQEIDGKMMKIKNTKRLLALIESNGKKCSNGCDGCPESEGDGEMCEECPDNEVE